MSREGIGRIGCVAGAMVVAALWASIALGQATRPAGNVEARAGELIKNRQYSDAIKLLQEQVTGKTDHDAARMFLMLGECLYMTSQYEPAQPYFTKALNNLSDPKEKTIAEYRLACLAVRLKDAAGAMTKIDNFITDHPKDSRVGRLLVFKMQILAAGGAEAEKDIEALREKIYGNIGQYDAIVGMEADQILCDFYRKVGHADKAEAAYTRIVHNFQKVIADLERDKQPVPPGIEKAYDNAALQLGLLAMEKKNSVEAAKWLGNVRYDVEMKSRARLMMAKIAYEKQDYAGAVAYLTEKDLLEAVPAGPIKSDMYLVLGMAEKGRSDGNPGKVEEYLRKVGSDSPGFTQAQSALGDIYREKGLSERAIECYKNALATSEFAPSALFYLGGFYLDAGSKETDAAKAKLVFSQAAKMYAQLFERYPLSNFAKDARPKIELLAAKGVDVGFAQSSDELVKGWQKTAAEKPGSREAAEALTSLMRQHFKRIAEEKTNRLIKAPDYVACAAACDKLLDDKVYTGQGIDPAAWKAMRAEANYHRGLCELSSISPADDGGGAKPAYLPKATAATAAGYLAKAKSLVDPKQLDIVKGIELALLESLFKSDKPEDRQAAEKRFSELENDYGNDTRFQKLSLDLAQWYQQNGRFAEAAKQYAGVADRSKEMSEEDTMRLLYTAGKLYSRAAWELQQQGPGKSGFCIQVYAPGVLNVADDVLKSYSPLQKRLYITWPNNGENVLAREALVSLSNAAGVPFVWSTAKGAGSIGDYLDTKKLSLKNGQYSVGEALGMVLDLKTHRLALDIGLCDGKPTLQAKAGADEDPDSERSRCIEIYPAALGEARYKPLAQPYGSWTQVHAPAGRGQGVMLYNVLGRLEELTQMRVIWAEGIDQQAKLAKEFKQVPAGTHANTTCADMLAATLAAADLKFRIAQREVWADLYEAAKDCFSKVRRISPGSKWGEKALFEVALNYYNLHDYPKMKAVLREYLKVFDAPGNESYHEACFWVGWCFEHERKYPDACAYYARAAEERLIICRPTAGQGILSRQQLKELLSYDSQSALAESVAGAFQDATLEDLAKFIRTNTHVDVQIDGAITAGAPTTRPAFRDVPAFDVLCDALDSQGLTFRVDNFNRKAAEKAYFRLASVYRRENLMEQALENCSVLLERYPQTSRRRDAQRMMIDIYRGLHDYGKVLLTLQDLQSSATEDAEKKQLDLEMAWIWFDVADYAKAAEMFKPLAAQASLGAAAREGYARSLVRLGKLPEALVEYDALAKTEGTGRQFAHRLMAFYLNFALGKAEERQLPDDAMRLITWYQGLSDDMVARISPEDIAKVTWVLYVQGMIDIKKNRLNEAIDKLSKIADSAPDEFVAGDTAYLWGSLHAKAGEFGKAREAFEHALVSMRSTESTVRVTWALGNCYERLGQTPKAVERYRQIVQRYPMSPIVEQVKKNKLYQDAERGASSRPTTGGSAE